MHASTPVFDYAREVAELREFGFAECLQLGGCEPGHRLSVARMESGRHGVAVEFLSGHEGSRYAVVALDTPAPTDGRVAFDWAEIVAEVRRRAPPTDDD